MKLEAFEDAKEKARFKIVRTDTCDDVPGRIVTADELTGECVLEVSGETTKHSYGPRGIRIISRRR